MKNWRVVTGFWVGMLSLAMVGPSCSSHFSNRYYKGMRGPSSEKKIPVDQCSYYLRPHVMRLLKDFDPQASAVVAGGRVSFLAQKGALADKTQHTFKFKKRVSDKELGLDIPIGRALAQVELSEGGEIDLELGVYVLQAGKQVDVLAKKVKVNLNDLHSEWRSLPEEEKNFNYFDDYLNFSLFNSRAVLKEKLYRVCEHKRFSEIGEEMKERSSRGHEIMGKHKKKLQLKALSIDARKLKEIDNFWPQVFSQKLGDVIYINHLFEAKARRELITLAKSHGYWATGVGQKKHGLMILGREKHLKLKKRAFVAGKADQKQGVLWAHARWKKRVNLALVGSFFSSMEIDELKKLQALIKKKVAGQDFLLWGARPQTSMGEKQQRKGLYAYIYLYRQFYFLDSHRVASDDKSPMGSNNMILAAALQTKNPIAVNQSQFLQLGQSGQSLLQSTLSFGAH